MTTAGASDPPAAEAGNSRLSLLLAAAMFVLVPGPLWAKQAATFGFGLSYTTFAYGNLVVGPSDAAGSVPV